MTTENNTIPNQLINTIKFNQTNSLISFKDLSVSYESEGGLNENESNKKSKVENTIQTLENDKQDDEEYNNANLNTISNFRVSKKHDYKYSNSIKMELISEAENDDEYNNLKIHKPKRLSSITSIKSKSPSQGRRVSLARISQGPIEVILFCIFYSWNCTKRHKKRRNGKRKWMKW